MGSAANSAMVAAGSYVSESVERRWPMTANGLRNREKLPESYELRIARIRWVEGILGVRHR